MVLEKEFDKTTHQINQIFQTLLSVLLPNHEGSEKFSEEEFTETLRYIGWKHKLDKNLFTPVAAPSTWGPLLCLLYWLYSIAQIYFQKVGLQEPKQS